MSTLSQPDPYRFTSYHEYVSVIDKIHSEEGIATFKGLAGAANFVKPSLKLDNRSNILLACIDEFEAYFALVAFKLAGNPSGIEDYQFAMGRLMSAFVSTLKAATLLARQHLFLPCGQLCRPLHEIANAILLCRMYVDFYKDFLASADLPEANNFWHKNISRRKDIAAIDRALDEGAQKPILFEMADGGLHNYFSSFVHPSMIGATIATYHDLGCITVGRAPDSSPINLLYYLLNQCFRILVISFGSNGLTQNFAYDGLEQLLPADTQLIGGTFYTSLKTLYLATIVRMWAVKEDSVAEGNDLGIFSPPTAA